MYTLHWNGSNPLWILVSWRSFLEYCLNPWRRKIESHQYDISTTWNFKIKITYRITIAAVMSTWLLVGFFMPEDAQIAYFVAIKIFTL